MEVWKAVVGYESRYEVSNRGRVRSIGRWAEHPGSKSGQRWWPSKMMKLTASTKPKKRIEFVPYLYVGLYAEGSKTQKLHLVHQLVLEAFRGLRPSKKHVGMHLDDNPSNNRLRNLKWGTYKENTQDMFAKGRNNQIFPIGENSTSAKLTEKKVLRIVKHLRRGWMVKDIAEKFEISSTTVSHIKAGRYWSHVTGIGVE
jgi:DNA-binding NarL/FixJ family response regulator